MNRLPDAVSPPLRFTVQCQQKKGNHPEQDSYARADRRIFPLVPVNPQFGSGGGCDFYLGIAVVNRSLRLQDENEKEKADYQQQNASQFLRVDDLVRQNETNPGVSPTVIYASAMNT
jgi:hypothetical protein